MIPDRSRWLVAFTSVVVLLPLTLGQSSAGGCGATPPALNSDSNTSPDNTLDATIVDTDGDGYTDDEEMSGEQGTDPDDPTDNPNSVRDSDGDGCSDYDELNFDGFCDNDPNTPLLACDTTFYNAVYHYGFYLPPNAELKANQGGGLFFRIWLFTFDNSRMGQSTSVYDAPAQSLDEFVVGLNQISEANGETIVGTIAFTLADGKPAYLIQTVTSLNIVEYQVITIADGFVYSLMTSVPNDAYTDAANAFMLGILDSLCFD